MKEIWHLFGWGDREIRLWFFSSLAITVRGCRRENDNQLRSPLEGVTPWRGL